MLVQISQWPQILERRGPPHARAQPRFHRADPVQRTEMPGALTQRWLLSRPCQAYLEKALRVEFLRQPELVCCLSSLSRSLRLYLSTLLRPVSADTHQGPAHPPFRFAWQARKYNLFLSQQ